MWLQYGIDQHGELVYIDQVKRGASELKCPYCSGLLTAKKGAIKAHHFAHTGETCRQTERDQDVIALPAYDNFNLHIPGKVIQHLYDFVNQHYGYNGQTLEHWELIADNDWNNKWELTKKGKLVVGQLSLMLFNEFQEPLLIEKHERLEEAARLAYTKSQLPARWEAYHAWVTRLKAELGDGENISYNSLTAVQREVLNASNRLYTELLVLENKKALDYETAIADLHLYRAQFRRILSCSLYFLHIVEPDLYKIGVTTRDIAERVAEIKTDLLPHYGPVAVNVIDLWPHRGNVELYFKYRYQVHNQKIGDLTEYFKFEDIKSVIRDLRRMKPKQLTSLEQSILAGELPAFEEQVRLEKIEVKRRAAISIGMKKAAKRGRAIGRPKTQAEAYLADHKAVVEALQAGLSLRQAAQQTGVTVGAVRKVKALLEQHD